MRGRFALEVLKSAQKELKPAQICGSSTCFPEPVRSAMSFKTKATKWFR